MVDRKTTYHIKELLHFLLTGSFLPFLSHVEFSLCLLCLYSLVLCVDVYLRRNIRYSSKDFIIHSGCAFIYTQHVSMLYYDFENTVVISAINTLFCHYVLPTTMAYIVETVDKLHFCFKLRRASLRRQAKWKSRAFYIIYIISYLVPFVFLCVFSIFVWNFWQEKYGIKIIDINDISAWECIPYISSPRKLWFQPTDKEVIIRTYHSNMSVTYLSNSATLEMPLMEVMKENSKLCKSYPGDDLHIKIDVTKYNFGNSKYAYYWTLNGRKIETFSPESRTFYKYKSWLEKHSQNETFHLVISKLKYNDFGTYMLHRGSLENENDSIPAMATVKAQWNSTGIYSQGGGKDIMMVDRKVLKVLLEKQEDTIKDIYSDVGMLIELNSFVFTLSAQNSTWYDYKFVVRYLINGTDIFDVCPMPESCFLSVMMNQYMEDLLRYFREIRREKRLKEALNLTQTNFYRCPLATTKAIVSFCVCPKAYGIHELYFDVRAPVRFRLLPSAFPTTNLMESCFYDSEMQYYFDMIIASPTKRQCWYTNMQSVFESRQVEEVHNILLWLFLVVVCFLSFDKVIRVVQFMVFSGRQINSTTIRKEYDVFLSYYGHSNRDRDFSRYVVSDYLENDLRLTVCTPDDIPPGALQHIKQTELISKSKTFILVLSNEYWGTDEMKLAYDLSLSSAIAASMIPTSNVLILKFGECPDTVEPLTRFSVVDWNNPQWRPIRSETEKKQELKEWLESKLTWNKWNFFSGTTRPRDLIFGM